MKMILTPADSPDAYIACLSGWQQSCCQALRLAVREAAPELTERLKWGHIVFFLNGPVLLIRAEPTRVLFGFWQGKRLRDIEPRLKPGGRYEMATLELRAETPLHRDTVLRLARRAATLDGAASGAVQSRQTGPGALPSSPA